MSNEISDSLIQEVLECNEMPSQWSDQVTGAKDTAIADHTHAETRETSRDLVPSAGDLVPSAGSLVPVAEHRIPESEAELNGLLNPLRKLIATAGVKLVGAPCGTWNIDGYAAKLC